MSKNNFCHFEIAATNPKKSAEFYVQLFGWKINNSMGDDYIFFQPTDGLSGAFMKAESVPDTTGVVAYIEVDDIDAYLQKAISLGGQQVTAKTDIPTIGAYGKFSDLDGNIIGLFTSQAN